MSNEGVRGGCVLARAWRSMCGIKWRDRKRTSELMSMLEFSEKMVIAVGSHPA